MAVTVAFKLALALALAYNFLALGLPFAMHGWFGIVEYAGWTLFIRISRSQKPNRKTGESIARCGDLGAPGWRR